MKEITFNIKGKGRDILKVTILPEHLAKGEAQVSDGSIYRMTKRELKQAKYILDEEAQHHHGIELSNEFHPRRRALKKVSLMGAIKYMLGETQLVYLTATGRAKWRESQLTKFEGTVWGASTYAGMEKDTGQELGDKDSFFLLSVSSDKCFELTNELGYTMEDFTVKDFAIPL
jgi:hypothetical protein